MKLQKIKAAPQATQHAEREYIDLHQFQRIDIVLVPLDKGAIVHGAVADWYGFIEPLAGQHKAADMLGKMTWKADQFFGERDRLADDGIIRIKSCLSDMAVGQLLAMAPHRPGARRGV